MGQQNQSVGQVEMKNFPALRKQILPVGVEASFSDSDFLKVPVVAPAGTVLWAGLEHERNRPGDRFALDLLNDQAGTKSPSYGTIVLVVSDAHPSGSPCSERAALNQNLSQNGRHPFRADKVEDAGSGVALNAAMASSVGAVINGEVSRPGGSEPPVKRWKSL